MALAGPAGQVNRQRANVRHCKHRRSALRLLPASGGVEMIVIRDGFQPVIDRRIRGRIGVLEMRPRDEMPEMSGLNLKIRKMTETTVTGRKKMRPQPYFLAGRPENRRG